MKSPSPELLEAPDGGYGWIITGTGFMCIFIIDGLAGTFGLVYPEFLREFNATPSITSMVGSIMIGTFLCVGISTGYLITRFGYRPVAFIGACLGTLGLSLSYFASDIWFLMITYGILTGIGIGMVYLPSMLIVNAYFSRKRGIAQGIVTSGSGLGILAIASLLETSLETYGWRGTMLICACLTLQLCIVAALMRPLEVREISESISVFENKSDNINSSLRNTEKLDDDAKDHNSFVTHAQGHNFKDNKQNFEYSSEKYSSTKSLPPSSTAPNKPELCRSLDCIKTEAHILKNRKEKHFRPISPLLQKDIYYSGSLKTMKDILKNSESQIHAESLSTDEEQMLNSDTSESNLSDEDEGSPICRKSLLTNKAFLLLVLGAALTQMAQYIPVVFLADHGIHIGVERRSIAIIIAIFGVVNTAGRLFAGILVNTRVVGALTLCNIGMFACAISCFLFPFCTTFESLIGFAVALGIFLGFFPPLQPLTVIEYAGLEHLTSAFGIMTMCKGPAAIAGPPLAGAVYEYTKNYSSSVFFAGILFLLTTIVQMMVPLCHRRKKPKLLAACMCSVCSRREKCSRDEYIKSDTEDRQSSGDNSSSSQHR